MMAATGRPWLAVANPQLPSSASTRQPKLLQVGVQEGR